MLLYEQSIVVQQLRITLVSFVIATCFSENDHLTMHFAEFAILLYQKLFCCSCKMQQSRTALRTLTARSPHYSLSLGSHCSAHCTLHNSAHCPLYTAHCTILLTTHCTQCVWLRMSTAWLGAVKAQLDMSVPSSIAVPRASVLAMQLNSKENKLNRDRTEFGVSKV